MNEAGNEHNNGGASTRGAPPRSGFGWLTVALSAAGTVLIILMAIGVNADILGRELINHPVPGVTEFLGLAIVSVVFLQIANTSREDRHISNDLLVSWVATRRPRLASFIYGVFHLVGAAIFLLIVWWVVPILLENYNGGYYKGTAGFVEIPVWPFIATVIVGAAAAAVQYVLLAIEQFRRSGGSANDV
ncbi:MAG: TRAP transporter small permease subunit [Rhodopseudomonas sp.]|nr:TRAP transporter small permease subunit [Rhodopseudomonas sp.]